MEDIKIQENGETEVQVACIGEVVGSDIHGNAVKQNFSEDSLKRIAETQNDDILVDADHSSETGGSTEAKGWLSKLNFVPGKGLFGKIKWTDVGRKLIENRVFRWLSPSWKLNAKTMEPLTMTSCALTNKPSQIGRIEPIVNAEPQEIVETIEKDINMTKDEIVALIDERVAAILNEKCNKEVATEETAMNAAPSEDKTKVEETVEETAAADVKEETNTEVAEEVAPVEEVKTEEAVEASEVADIKTETEEPKTEEVIKLETLNSAPIVKNVDEWKNLHSAAFWKYLKDHPEVCQNNR